MVKFEEKREWIGGQANTSNTLFENHRKSLILRLYERIHFDRTKVHKNAKNGQFGDFLKDWSLWTNSVTRLMNFRRTKINGKWQISKNEMRHFWCFSNRSYFKIYWKYWKRKKLREKMCYFPLCCVRIGPKSNHQQSLSPIFFQMDKKRRWWRDFLFCQTESFLVFQRAFLARRRLSFFRRRTAFPINWKLPVHLAWHCC